FPCNLKGLWHTCCPRLARVHPRMRRGFLPLSAPHADAGSVQRAPPPENHGVNGPHNVHCVTVATAVKDQMSIRCSKRQRWHECCSSNFNGKSREGSKLRDSVIRKRRSGMQSG